MQVIDDAGFACDPATTAGEKKVVIQLAQGVWSCRLRNTSRVWSSRASTSVRPFVFETNRAAFEIKRAERLSRKNVVANRAGSASLGPKPYRMAQQRIRLRRKRYSPY